MKNNLYQKIVIALYLACLGLIVVFFVPYKVGYRVYTNEFDSIWSDKSGLNNLRLFMELLILTIVFSIFYFLVAKFENPDFNVQKTKKFIKREIKILLLFIVINGCLQVYFPLYNYVERGKIENYNQEISILQNKNDSLYRLAIIDGKNSLEKLWGFLQDKNEDFPNFDQFEIDINDDSTRTILYHALKNSNVKLPDFEGLGYIVNSDTVYVASKDKKTFIKNYPYARFFGFFDSLNQSEINKNTNEISEFRSEKSKINIFDNGEMKTISLVFGLIAFGCLYVLRLLYYYVKRLYLYLK